jgi:hypothetical protein
MKVRVTAIVMALCAVMGMAVFVAQPASAAAGCYGDYCSGQDPSLDLRKIRNTKSISRIFPQLLLVIS